MKKAGRVAFNTPSRLRVNLQAVLSRSQSTGTLFTEHQRLAADIKKFPETLSKHTPLRSKLFSRNASVPSLRAEAVLQLTRVPQAQGTRSVPNGGTPVFALNTNMSPQPSRKIHRTPPKYPTNPLLPPPPTPNLLKQKRSMPDLTRPPPLLNIEFEAETRVQSRAVSRRKASGAGLPLGQYTGSGKREGSVTRLPSVDGTLPNTVQRLSFKTRTGSIGGRPKPHNQDNYLLVHDFNGTKHQRLLAVFDGHGEIYLGVHGHDVSAYVKTHLAAYLDRALPKAVQSNVQLPIPREIARAIRGGLVAGVQAMNQDLVRKTQIDTSFSGSTAIIAVVRGTTIITANVGDSRAILGRKTEYGWKAIELSHDQKPNNPDELNRIQANGGRVMPFVGTCYSDPNTGAFIGPSRVWMQQEPIPGLAMSRSIGDFVASQLGVISEPEVTMEDFKPEDKFIVLASDGVWEFMSNQRVRDMQCVDMIASYWEEGNIDGACDAVVKEAVALWKKVVAPQEDEVVDDITILLAFLAC